MKNKWWNVYFTSSYNRFCNTLKFIIIISQSLRILTSIIYSFESAFGGNEIIYFLIMFSIYLSLNLLKSKNENLKKIVMYSLLEVLNVALRTSSTLSNKHEAILLCLESTLVTLLYQCNIFSGELVSQLIPIKHLILWYFLNEDHWVSSAVTSYMINIVIIFIWTTFEKDKRKYLLETYKSKKHEKKAIEDLSNILKIFPQGLVILNQNLEVEYTNDLIQEITKGQNFLDYTKHNYLKDSNKTLFEVIEQHPTQLGFTSLGLSQSENSKYEWKINVITWKKTVCYMITVNDVTKILDFERISAANQAKTEIIRSISHELRTPINHIMWIIQEILPSSESLKSRITQIKNLAELLLFQINDILDYSEICLGKFALNPKVFRISDSVSACIQLISDQVQCKKVELKNYLDPSLTEIFADEYRVQKIIMNLLTNALRNTTKGAISLSVIQIENSVKFEVTDTGSGLSAEQISGIFKIKHSLSQAKSGGIGLYICKKILKYFKSEFFVRSQLGFGSSFSFVLLCDQRSLAVNDPVSCDRPNDLRFSLLQRTVKSCPRLLIVDDNDFNRMFLSNALTKKNILFLEAVNGQEAVKIVLDQDLKEQNIYCIIMDINMPVMDGWEASRFIKSLFAENRIKIMPSIIAHTAYSSETDKVLCFDSGMVDFIVKPTPAEEILNRISKYIS